MGAVDPSAFEGKWSEFWEKSGLYKASSDDPNTYTILMPPPNVTARLHMGHGTCFTFQDILVRWQRMLGKNACWLPGTDHAGIATQMMVERDLWEKEKKGKEDLGREQFVARCQKWKEENGAIIYEQFKRIGFSADWSRAAYTMDSGPSAAVRKIFVRLFEDRLIYRGHRLINWDPVLKTAVSDDEVYNEEVDGSLYSIKYSGPNGEVVVATTRPETLFGDTAVAVHPDDERYRHLIGRTLKVPLCERMIPVVADEHVRIDFGTGALKVTPAHDVNDFQIGLRHKLPSISIFDEEAKLNSEVPLEFRGLHRDEARKKVTRALKEQGLLVEQKSIRHTVPFSDRSKSAIEPRLSHQWFVKMNSMAASAAEAARKGEIRFFPELWAKTYLHWLDNIQDWCISRQLWWGHRIPIWTCESCSEQWASEFDPHVCHKCRSEKIMQESDVLDTWFSSWLWPLSTMGWPDQSDMDANGFKNFFPSNVLMTGPDIIFLWVARMVMASLYVENKVPFRDVFFSAIVVDKQGRKFSKTLGNGIDPIEVINTYGADAVRFTSTFLAPQGGRIAMDKSDFEMGSRFANKIWHAAAFIKTWLSGNPIVSLQSQKLRKHERWLLQNLSITAERIDQYLGCYRFHEAAQAIYQFIWTTFCDWAIETAKVFAKDAVSESVLLYCFDQSLRLLSPVMPFVTEEIWQSLPRHPDLDRPSSITVASFPKKLQQYNFDDWQDILDLVAALRSSRQNVGLASRDKLNGFYNKELFASDDLEMICRLGSLNSLERCVSQPRPSLLAATSRFSIFLEIESNLALKEVARLKNEKNRLTKIAEGTAKKILSLSLSGKAPPDVIAETRQTEAKVLGQLEAIEASLIALEEI